MPKTHADLLRELTEATETFSNLGERLSEVAAELRVSGRPPSPQLVEELAVSRSSFDELRARAIELAGLLASSSAKPAEDIQSLKDLKTLLQSLEETANKRTEEEKLKQEALKVLDLILTLSHRNETDFQPLLSAQDKAKELRRGIAELTWPDLHPEAESLANRRHPFAEFLTLVEGHETLNDDLWLLLKHAVSESFGRTLSLAAARGKLVLEQLTGAESPAPPDRSDHIPQSGTRGKTKTSRSTDRESVTFTEAAS